MNTFFDRMSACVIFEAVDVYVQKSGCGPVKQHGEARTSFVS